MKKFFLMIIVLVLVSCQNNKVDGSLMNDSNSEISNFVVNRQNTNEIEYDESSEELVGEKAQESEHQVMIIADVLNVRSSNDIDSDIIGKIPYGDVYFVEEMLLDTENRKWYRIDYDGVDGWIAEWFCYDYFEISTLEEFVTSLGSHRMLKLTSDIANIDMILNDSDEQNDYLNDHRISGVSNLIIEGDLDEPIKFYTSETKTALTFEGCSNISIRGLNIGHDSGPCEGDVIRAVDTKDISIESSILFGCGFTGISSSNSDVTVLNSKIWDCSDSAFNVDESSTLLVDNCIIEEVPSLFSGFWGMINLDVRFKNSMIFVPLFEDSIYNDRLFREGERHFKLNFYYDDIDFEDTLYMPNSKDSDIISFLGSIELDKYISLKLIPNADKFDLNMIINYENLNEIDSLVEKLMSDVHKSKEISIEDVFGTIVKGEETVGRWRWDKGLEKVIIDEVYYPYTGEIFGVNSIDLKSYIIETFDLEKIFLEGVMAIEILPSYMKDEQLIHEAVFEFVAFAADFDYYIGAMMLIRYNQTEDTLEIEFENDTFKKIGTVPSDVLGVIDTYKEMYNLFVENAEHLYEDTDYKCKYTFTQEEFDFINDAFDSIFMDEFKEKLKKDIQLVEMDGVYYSKNNYNDLLLDLKIYEPIIFNENDLYIYSLDGFQFDATLTIMKQTDDGYKFDSHRKVKLMNKNDEKYSLHSKWYINFLNYK